MPGVTQDDRFEGCLWVEVAAIACMVRTVRIVNCAGFCTCMF